MNKSIPSLAQITALDGRIFATLNPEEVDTLNFYRARGRKFDVLVTTVSG